MYPPAMLQGTDSGIAEPTGTTMHLKRLRDIASWMVLASSLFFCDWNFRGRYRRINQYGSEETTAPVAARFQSVILALEFQSIAL